MARVLKLQGVRDMLKKAGGFFNVMKEANIVKAEHGTLVAELTVGKDHVNQFGTLHGGLSATLIDTFTCCAILTHDKGAGDYGSSVELHIRYFKSAKIGDQLVITAETDRAGNYLSYLKCDIKNKNTGDLIAKGTQTVFMDKASSRKINNIKHWFEFYF